MNHFLSPILIFSLILCAQAAHWNYQHQNEWPDVCTTGDHQSPIEIYESQTQAATFDPLVFEYYNIPPKAESMTNNGHSVTFTLKPIRDITFPKVLDGGLPGIYQFEQFHFHWGEADQRGSEHSINGATHPMELHFVHFNTLYGSNLSDAMKNSNNYDTIAVLSVLFEIQEEDNPALDLITNQLQYLTHQNDIVNDIQLFPLNTLLPKDTHHFYRYNGSLTTPPCSEIVVWTIFKETVPVSEAQLRKFRAIGDLPALSNGFEAEGDNFRDYQPLNGRVVLDVETSYFNPQEASRIQDVVQGQGSSEFESTPFVYTSFVNEEVLE